MAHGANGGSWQPQISQVTQVLLNQGLVFMIWLAYLYVCTWQVIFSHDVLFKIDIFRQCHPAGVNCEYTSLCFFIRKWEFNLPVNAPWRVVKSKSKLWSNTSITNSFKTNTAVCNTPFIGKFPVWLMHLDVSIYCSTITRLHFDFIFGPLGKT